MSSEQFDALYQQLILDHARSPYGRADTSGAPTRSHQVNPTCGDDITVAIGLDGDSLADVHWEGHGCAISQASASLMAGLVEGIRVGAANELIDGFRAAMRSQGRIDLDEERFGDAIALNGVSRYVARVKCAMLAWVALEDALRATGPGGTSSSPP